MAGTGFGLSRGVAKIPSSSFSRSTVFLPSAFLFSLAFWSTSISSSRFCTFGVWVDPEAAAIPLGGGVVSTFLSVIRPLGSRQSRDALLNASTTDAADDELQRPVQRQKRAPKAIHNMPAAMPTRLLPSRLTHVASKAIHNMPAALRARSPPSRPTHDAAGRRKALLGGTSFKAISLKQTSGGTSFNAICLKQTGNLAHNQEAEMSPWITIYFPIGYLSGSVTSISISP